MRAPYLFVLATGLGLALGGCTESSSPGSDETESSSGGETNAVTSESSTDPSAEVSTTTDTAGTDTSDTDASDTASTDATESSDSADTDPGPCEYPEGAVEPMALNEVLWAYSWPAAKRADGLTTPLDLTKAHCDTDDVIDWSPHDVLVFVSIPAW